MQDQETYEAPEVIELGDAEELTLGWASREYPDGCDCTKWTPPSN